MKAMLLTGIHQMEMFDVPTPEIKNDTDVLIRIATVGVCGSDVHYYNNGRIGDQVVKFPFALGHECSGIVEKVGSSVSRVKQGDRIAIDPAMPCWECAQCKAGRFHTCLKTRFLGCPDQADGCLSEYIVMPETSCFLIGSNLTLDDAALSEPLSIGVYAVKLSQIKPDMDIAILGAGPIGNSVMVAATAKNAGKIFITDKLDYRVDFARSGAYWAGNPDKVDVTAAVKEAEPLLLDIVYECCGKQDAINQAVTLLKPGGKLMLIGIPEEDEIAIPIAEVRRKEICIQNVRRQNESIHDTLDILNSGKYNVGRWATHRFKLSESKKAFDLVAGYKDGVIKAMIDIS